MTKAPRSSITVIKVGGALLDDPLATRAMLDAVVEAARHGSRSAAAEARPRVKAREAMDSANGIIIVHGGGRAVDRQLERMGLGTERRDGIRITPPEQMDQIAGVLAGVINTALVGHFTSRGVPAVGLGLTDGLCCRVEVARRYAFDPGRVGEITGGDGLLLQHLLQGGFLPVMSSIGLDPDGGLLNVNADDAAAAVAALVGASTLLLLTDVPGVRGLDGEIVPSIDRAQAESWIGEGVISGGMTVKVRGALDAAEHAGSAVGRVLIASWNDPATLREILTGGHAGTRVIASRDRSVKSSPGSTETPAMKAPLISSTSHPTGAPCAHHA
ncbi:MAG: acetylglutamate kinase [Phycisphaeraceae bacterium]|nr:acetylglutamate kinase [Phycisphaeraceae bacterium]